MQESAATLDNTCRVMLKLCISVGFAEQTLRIKEDGGIWSPSDHTLAEGLASLGTGLS